MKLTFRIITVTSAVTLTAFTASAQKTPASQPMSPGHMRGATDSAGQTMPPGSRTMESLGQTAKASDLIGMDVKNYQDEKLGEVDDFAVEVQTGRIVYVIVATGGFAGMGESHRALPPSALHHDTAKKVLHLDTDKAKFKASPMFEKSKWSESASAERVSESYRYYDAQPDFMSAYPETISSIRATRQRDGSMPNKERAAKETEMDNSWAKMSYVQPASKVMGASITNLQDEKLGKVENLAVDLAAGRVVAVIVSSGGFMGMNGEMSAVPPAALRYNESRDQLQLDATKETMASAPHFKADMWPDLGEPAYTDGVYRAYRAEPYFGMTKATPAADNSARNVSDRGGRRLTPLDQGNGQADIDITAQIRKDIIAGKGMSMNARNVKIITKDGRVTLRGPVGTAEEKMRIGEFAMNAASGQAVDNQLEVK